MKFVCDRCQTRYSIADEKVRQKILRIRCKSCGNVIVVQDAHGGASGAGVPGAEPHWHDSARPGSTSGPKVAPSSGPKAVPSSGPKAVPSSGPKVAPRPALRAGAAAPPPPPREAKGADSLGGHVEWHVGIDG